MSRSFFRKCKNPFFFRDAGHMFRADIVHQRPMHILYRVMIAKTVRMISLLFSTLVWTGHPATGPTSGSFAYSYKLSASDSFHGRKISRSVSNLSDIISVLPLTLTVKSVRTSCHIPMQITKSGFIPVCFRYSPQNLLPKSREVTAYFQTFLSPPRSLPFPA